MNDKRKILVVDDDVDLCNLIYEILLDENYVVNKAYDGVTALDFLKKENYDLMIIDNKLKGMTGTAITKEAKKINSDLKALMISAFGTDKTKAEAREVGIIEFIDKPFQITSLVDCVKNVLN